MKYFLFFLVLLVLWIEVEGDWFDDQPSSVCSTYPRVRKSWCRLTYVQRKTWVEGLKLLKTTKVPGSTVNIYQSMVDMHSTIANSEGSHGTVYFFGWHRLYVYILESLMRHVLYTNRNSLNLTVDDACSFACPYWAWEADYDDNTNDTYIPQDHSCLWEYPELLGNPPTHLSSDYEVKSGAFKSGSWLTSCCSNLNPVNFTNAFYGDLTYTLKREFNVVYNNVYGPSQIMLKMKTTSYSSFMSYIEAGPHSFIHLWLGFCSKSMSSPEDIIFWLNHGNIERLHTMYLDCHDAEFLDPNGLTWDDYTPLNPNPMGKVYKKDVYGVKIDVSLDSIIPYWWKAFMTGKSKNYTFTDLPFMRRADFPTPRQIYFVGNKGWKNMSYTYDRDALVEVFGSTCCSNKWTYFPSPLVTVAKKREVSEESEISDTSEVLGIDPNTKRVYTKITRQFSDLKKKGLCNTDALEALAMQECLDSTRPPPTPDFQDWLKMNGLVPESFIRICENGSDYSKDQGVIFSLDVESGTRYASVNISIVIGCVVAGGLLLIGIIVGVVLIVRKKNKKAGPGDVVYLNY